MIRTINFFISAPIWLIVLYLFDHSSSRDYTNYISVLTFSNKSIEYNSLFFSFYAFLTSSISLDPKTSYHLFQFFTFCIFTNALLKLMRYSLVKYIICLTFLAPVFVPLYFLVQIKMGLALSLFIWSCTLTNVSKYTAMFFSLLSHLYAPMLLYFTKSNLIKRGIWQVSALAIFLFCFVLVSPMIGYGFIRFLGHQEKINLVNSLFLIFLLISLAALLSPSLVGNTFNAKAFIFGGLLVYLVAFKLQFPVLGIRTLELFSCVLLIWVFTLQSPKGAIFISPLLAVPTFYHTYYIYFVFGLFI